jgi:hypothetical protein
LLQRGLQRAGVRHPLEHLPVRAGDGGKHPHPDIDPDPGPGPGGPGLDGALDQDAERGYQPGAFAGDGDGEDPGPVFGQQAFQPAGVLVDADSADLGEGDVAAVWFDPDGLRW